MRMKDALLQRIKKREIVVGVVGMGYVGLPLAVAKAKAGFKTIGFEVDRKKVEAINAGKNYIDDVDEDELAFLVQSGSLLATDDYSMIARTDFVAICVPTPLDAHRQPDISYIQSAAKSIAQNMHPAMMIVLESTTYPGTTEELLLPLLEEESGLICGKDFYLGFSPERVDPGNSVYKTKNTPKVVGAVGKDATEVISRMYRAVVKEDIFETSSPAVAEMEKVLENTYRNINIGLMNELAQLCHKMDIDIWEVIEAAKTKPYGFQAFYPGPGLGGHCIPLDPYFLSWKARQYNFHISMIENSMTINDKMAEYCVKRIADILNRDKKALNGAKILQLGIAYKQEISDYRESPAIKVFEILQSKGAVVQTYDPYISHFKGVDGQDYICINQLTEKLIADADIVVIATGHKNVDYKTIQKHAHRIFDTKNIMRSLSIFGSNVEVL